MLRALRPQWRSPVQIFKAYSHYNAPPMDRPKVTLQTLRKMKKEGTPITAITAHDYISGLMADRAGVDIVLVGDSLAMVAMGHPNTNEITLEDMVYHSRAVSRGVSSAFLAADLPFGAYEINPDRAHESAIKMVKTGFAEAVKMEGGVELAPTIEKLTSTGIPVVGHIGLTPQRQTSLGGFKVQGKSAKTATSVLNDALAIEAAGASLIVLEAVPDRVGELITKKLKVPTIGIGAGPGTSGQVLVQLDMLGGFDGFQPKFLKRYSNYLEENTRAIKEYKDEVKSGKFPAPENCYDIKDTEFEKFRDYVESL